MTRAFTTALVVLVLASVSALTLFGDDSPAPQLGHAPPTHAVGVEPVDNVPSHPVGVRVVARAAGRAKRAVVGNVWDALAACESGGDWSYNGPSGYDGGVQFHPGTWSSYRPADFPEYAWQATREQQILVAERVLAAEGWGAWPVCSRVIGAR